MNVHQLNYFAKTNNNCLHLWKNVYKKLMRYTILVVGSLLLSFGEKAATKIDVMKTNPEGVCPSSNCSEVQKKKREDETARISLQNPYKFSSNIKTFFQNLYTYSPANSHGSCGYVSLIQFMSYFDTFYNDSIIPEAYDRSKTDASSASEALASSPGVLRQSYPENGTQLYNFIQNNYQNDFQMRLMKIANETDNKIANEYECGVGMWQYDSILSSLYNNSASYFMAHYYDEYASSPNAAASITQFDSYVKNQLDEGNPIILHIGQFDDETQTINNYHSVVAYYYDSEGIHCNYGWGSDSTDIVIPSGTVITSACEFNKSLFSERHSNNYVYNSNYYCGCGDHLHHYEAYIRFNATYHTARCVCGFTVRKQHVFKAYGIDDGGTCVYCGYEK